MTTWPTVQLRRVALLAYGDSLPNESRSSGGVEVFGSNGPIGTHDRPNTRSPVVIVGRKGSFGKIQFADQPVFTIDTTYFVDESCTRENLRWIFYLLQSLCLDDLSTDVGVPGLSREMVYEQRVPLPPQPVQEAIAGYLDRETSRVDALIAAKQEMVRLLAERMQSLTSGATHAQAAIDDACAIPDGWKRMPLRRCLESMTYGTGEAAETVGEYAVLGMSNIQGGEVTNTGTGFISTVDCQLLVEVGDLLFNRTNSRELVGKVGIVRSLDRATTFASYLVRLRTNQFASAAYLNYLLNTREVLGLARSMALPSIGQANLNPSRYSTIALPLPPAEEQLEIAALLDETRRHTTHMTHLLERQVSLLQERRHALITAAVTGQLDLSEAA